MREVLIGSPAIAFAFGVQTLHSSGPVDGTKPQGRLRRPVHRQSRTEVRSGGTPPATSGARCMEHPSDVCARPKPQRVVHLACQEQSSAIAVSLSRCRGSHASPAQDRGFLAHFCKGTIGPPHMSPRSCQDCSHRITRSGPSVMHYSASGAISFTRRARIVPLASFPFLPFTVITSPAANDASAPHSGRSSPSRSRSSVS